MRLSVKTRTPPEDAVAKQLKDAGVEVQTIDETWTRIEAAFWPCQKYGMDHGKSSRKVKLMVKSMVNLMVKLMVIF